MVWALRLPTLHKLAAGHGVGVTVEVAAHEASAEQLPASGSNTSSLAVGYQASADLAKCIAARKQMRVKNNSVGYFSFQACLEGIDMHAFRQVILCPVPERVFLTT